MTCWPANIFNVIYIKYDVYCQGGRLPIRCDPITPDPMGDRVVLLHVLSFIQSADWTQHFSLIGANESKCVSVWPSTRNIARGVR